VDINSIIKNQDGLYHRDVGFPKNWVELLPRNFRPTNIKLTYGSHARKEALSDKYGSIELPQTLAFNKDALYLFEIEIKDGKVVKLGVRKSHDELNDLIIIFQPNDGFVRTVWLNRKEDSHKTLDTSKYRKP